MTREEKNTIIDSLVELLSAYNGFYITDISNLNSEQTSQLRRICFQKQIKMNVAKNSLIKKALEKIDAEVYRDVMPALKGSSALMLSETANLPAKMIKEFRKKGDKPQLKAAYVEASVFLGDNQLDVLASLKSKNELIGELVGLLQSPARNVISALQSGGNTIAGLVKSLEERAA